MTSSTWVSCPRVVDLRIGSGPPEGMTVSETPKSSARNVLAAAAEHHPRAASRVGSMVLPRYEKHDSIYALESSRRTDWAVRPVVPNGPAGHP